MEKYIENEYRKFMWEKTKIIIDKLSNVFDIKKCIVLGSFTTKKERPADVDLIILIQLTDDDKTEWSTDIVFAPNNDFGIKTIEDAESWMEEKYGKNNYLTFEYKMEKL